MVAVCLGQGVRALVPIGLEGGRTQNGPVGRVGPVGKAWPREEPGPPGWSVPLNVSRRKWAALGTPVFP
eukprot:4898533-Heterocapsa_arctica.AAC.1